VGILPLRINCPGNRVLAISSSRYKLYTINIILCLYMHINLVHQTKPQSHRGTAASPRLSNSLSPT
jgi:hypothetical protein